MDCGYPFHFRLGKRHLTQDMTWHVPSRETKQRSENQTPALQQAQECALSHFLTRRPKKKVPAVDQWTVNSRLRRDQSSICRSSLAHWNAAILSPSQTEITSRTPANIFLAGLGAKQRNRQATKRESNSEFKNPTPVTHMHGNIYRRWMWEKSTRQASAAGLAPPPIIFNAFQSRGGTKSRFCPPGVPRRHDKWRDTNVDPGDVTSYTFQTKSIEKFTKLITTRAQQVRTLT